MLLQRQIVCSKDQDFGLTVTTIIRITPSPIKIQPARASEAKAFFALQRIRALITHPITCPTLPMREAMLAKTNI